MMQYASIPLLGLNNTLLEIDGVNLFISEETLSAVLEPFGEHHFCYFHPPHCVVEFLDEESASNAVTRLRAAYNAWNHNHAIEGSHPEPEIGMRVTVVKCADESGGFRYSAQ